MNRREARLLQLIEHPFLPQMIDYAERGEYCYIIMEYIRGKSLEQYLQEGRRFSVEEILYISDVILQVLDYLHSRKPAIFYGDLKPANLMLTEQNRLYLVDFGSAAFSYDAFYKEKKGTRGYAAPEQYKGKMNAASDFFALGKTMERLCDKQKWYYLLKCPALGRFVLKCCRKESDKRWKNASEARKELSKIHPIHIKLSSVLLPAAAAVTMLLIILKPGLPGRDLPELSISLSPITAEYFTMDYRTGQKAMREQINIRIEKRLQNLLRTYQKSEEQIRILELLARNGELADRADRAELYYRQLITYEPDYLRGYLEYGMFLCRQARYQESRAVYRQWKNRIEDNERPMSEEEAKEWDNWKKEAGVILGRKKTSFI